MSLTGTRCRGVGRYGSIVRNVCLGSGVYTVRRELSREALRAAWRAPERRSCIR